jgi:hypothetical protein
MMAQQRQHHIDVGLFTIFAMQHHSAMQRVGQRLS